jgi:tetratricopeptide (TPR) repeat protein
VAAGCRLRPAAAAAGPARRPARRTQAHDDGGAAAASAYTAPLADLGRLRASCCYGWQATLAELAAGRTAATPMLVAASVLLAFGTAAAGPEQSGACESEDGSVWELLRSTLGSFQPPAARLSDYRSYESLESPSDHLHRRGVALDREGRPAEALAAFEKAAEIEPTDAAHWNNVGVAAMRQHDAVAYSAAVPALENALRRDPENRLAAGNHQLASAVSQLRGYGLWGGALGQSPTQSLQQASVWCEDDDAAVIQLTKERYKDCAGAAAAAAQKFGGGDRSTAAARAVCMACPAACGLCPAPESWVEQWWRDGGSNRNSKSGVGYDARRSSSPGESGGGTDVHPCTIERRSAASLSPAEFASEYIARRVPVMLSGAAYASIC